MILLFIIIILHALIFNYLLPAYILKRETTHRIWESMKTKADSNYFCFKNQWTTLEKTGPDLDVLFLLRDNSPVSCDVIPGPDFEHTSCFETDGFLEQKTNLDCYGALRHIYTSIF